VYHLHLTLNVFLPAGSSCVYQEVTHNGSFLIIAEAEYSSRCKDKI